MYWHAPDFLQLVAPEGPATQVARIGVPSDFDGDRSPRGGIVWPDAVIAQQREAARILEAEKPERVVTFGGDYLVSQAPFDYLHGVYDDLGIVWVDCHPDITTPANFNHAHAMVLGNLLGEGSPELASFVEHPFSHEDVFWAGLSHDGMEPWEDEYFAAHDLTWAAPEELEKTSEPLVHWVRERDFGHVAVHFDVDVLSPDDFKSTYLSAPGRDYSGVTAGKMTLAQVTRLLCDLAEVTDIVGLTIAEVMPWDYVALKQQLARLEILAG